MLTTPHDRWRQEPTPATTFVQWDLNVVPQARSDVDGFRCTGPRTATFAFSQLMAGVFEESFRPPYLLALKTAISKILQ